MHPAESVATFQNAVVASGTTVEELNAMQALAQMLAFYRDVRAEGCDQDEEEDTLIWKWGMYVQGQTSGFQVELIRCFIEPGTEDEDGMSQLTLTLRYPPLKRCRHWAKARTGADHRPKARRSSPLFSQARPAMPPPKSSLHQQNWSGTWSESARSR